MSDQSDEDEAVRRVTEQGEARLAEARARLRELSADLDEEGLWELLGAVTAESETDGVRSSEREVACSMQVWLLVHLCSDLGGMNAVLTHKWVKQFRRKTGPISRRIHVLRMHLATMT